MDILITHGPRTRSLHVHPLQLTAFVLGVIVLILGLSGVVYHYIFLKAAREGWPIVSNVTGLMVRDEGVQRDRFMRENLDAMARKVGEMQARMVRLEAIGSRVSGLAGIKPEELRAMDASAPAAAASAPVKTGGLAAPVGNSGGPYIPVDSPSMEQINDTVAQMEAQAEHHGDVFTLIESRLLERRLASLVIPSIAPVEGPIGSGFGFRLDPFTGRAALHTGLDFPAHQGTPINVAAGGVVHSVGKESAYGLMVEVDHGNGLITRYAHSSKVLVKSGELVRRGQPIALVGSTGRSTGPHLHFEVLLDGVPQNPQRFLSARNENLASAPMDPRSGPRDKGRKLRVR